MNTGLYRRKSISRKYYEAYDDRYQQIHEQNLQWFSEAPSPIVVETIRAFDLSPQAKLLEIGCGEGRDAYPLLTQGFDLLATDISPEAIAFCQRKFPEYASRFQVADCVAGTLDGQFDFVYAVAVLHMLVSEEDRNGFYRFIRTHLTRDGIALAIPPYVVIILHKGAFCLLSSFTGSVQVGPDFPRMMFAVVKGHETIFSSDTAH